MAQMHSLPIQIHDKAHLSGSRNVRAQKSELKTHYRKNFTFLRLTSQ